MIADLPFVVARDIAIFDVWLHSGRGRVIPPPLYPPSARWLRWVALDPVFGAWSAGLCPCRALRGVSGISEVCELWEVCPGQHPDVCYTLGLARWVVLNGERLMQGVRPAAGAAFLAQRGASRPQPWPLV